MYKLRAILYRSKEIEQLPIADQKAIIAEGSEKQRRMYNDLQAVRIEMHVNQNLREELLESNMDMRRLRAELESLPP